MHTIIVCKNLVVLCCLMYLAVDIAYGVRDLIVGTTLGLELGPPSDKPYLTTSLQDFGEGGGSAWYQIHFANRHTIYKPTGVKKVGHRWALLTGVMATFIVSGLMHELATYATRVTPTWEVTWFFVLLGVCVVLEMAVKRDVGQIWRVHWAISGPLIVGFMMKTAFGLSSFN